MILTVGDYLSVCLSKNGQPAVMICVLGPLM